MIEINKSGKTAVLIGSTGLVGGFCLEHLLQHDAYSKVITFGRRKSEVRHEKLSHHVVDFAKLETIYSVFTGDDLYLCLGTTIGAAGSKKQFIQVDFTYNLTLARMAEQRKFNQLLLVSAVGANRDSLFFYNQVKGYLEDEVKKLSFWSTHIFRPSVLLGDRTKQRFGEQAAGSLGKVLDRISGGMLMKYKPVEAEVVAVAMIQAAQQLTPGQHFYPSDQLQRLSEQYYKENPS